MEESASVAREVGMDDAEAEEQPTAMELDDETLDRIFTEFTDPERVARMEGHRVAIHFHVKMRGQDANVLTKGDKYDVARAQPQGKEIVQWTQEHFQHASKSIEIHLAGSDEAAGKLCREWCRKMDYLYGVFQDHGSWAAAGGTIALDSYQEDPDYTSWVSALPDDYCKKKAEEIRSLRPMDMV